MTTAAVDEALQAVRGALGGLGGTLPRRAVVLHNGEVADRAAHPHLPEVTAVSLACEALRRAAGEPVFSRVTPRLLEQCLASNDPGAWRALLDDEATGDLDTEAATAFWDSPANLHRLVWCLVRAPTGTDLWVGVRAMQGVLALTGKAGAHVLGLAFHHQFPDLVRALSRRCKDVSAEQRAYVIATLGRLIAWCDIAPASLADMLGRALEGPVDDVLRLFVHAPLGELASRDPDLVPKVLRRAERASQVGRYPSLALLAMVDPRHLAGHAERVRALVQRTLDTAAAQGSVEPGMALACGVLAKATAPARSLDAALAHALCCMAVPLLAPAAAAP